MNPKWSDNSPIYLQLREHAIGLILDGVLGDGDPLPSVRTVAADFQLNPITVSKAYQSLVDDELVERRRGLGMFVKTGAKDALLRAEREKFLEKDWPQIVQRIHRLGLSEASLLEAAGEIAEALEESASEQKKNGTEPRG